MKHYVSQEVDGFKTILSKLQEDVAELISTTEQLKRESDALNNLQQCTEVSVEQLEETVEQQEENNEKSIELVQKHLREKEDTIKAMTLKIDALEQRNKQANLRIIGLEEEDEENITSKFIDLATHKLNIKNIQASDFEVITRMGTKNCKEDRDVMVTCNNINIRNQMYKRRKSLRNGNNSIYINEDLTTHRSKLFYHARKMRKAGKLFGVWSQDGNIMVKVKESSQPTAVQDYDALKELFQNLTGIDNKHELDVDLSDDDP